MATDRDSVSERIGKYPNATFEVARGTDTEDVRADPESVAFGQHTDGPLVMLNYNKYHSGLPPWRNIVAFTLDGDEVGTFVVPEFKGTQITGRLKTIRLVSPKVKFK